MHNSCSQRAVHRSIERQFAERRRMYRNEAFAREAESYFSSRGGYTRGRHALFEFALWSEGL